MVENSPNLQVRHSSSRNLPNQECRQLTPPWLGWRGVELVCSLHALPTWQCWLRRRMRLREPQGPQGKLTDNPATLHWNNRLHPYLKLGLAQFITKYLNILFVFITYNLNVILWTRQIGRYLQKMFEMPPEPSLPNTLMRNTPVRARKAAPHVVLLTRAPDAAERRGTNTVIVCIMKPALVAVVLCSAFVCKPQSVNPGEWEEEFCCKGKHYDLATRNMRYQNVVF